MRAYAAEEDVELTDEIKRLETRLNKLMEDVYSKLSRWQRYQLAKHPDRPFTQDYINLIFTDFVELHGDRMFADDPALVAGLVTGRLCLWDSKKGEPPRKNWCVISA